MEKKNSGRLEWKEIGLTFGGQLRRMIFMIWIKNFMCRRCRSTLTYQSCIYCHIDIGNRLHGVWCMDKCGARPKTLYVCKRESEKGSDWPTNIYGRHWIVCLFACLHSKRNEQKPENGISIWHQRSDGSFGIYRERTANTLWHFSQFPASVRLV